MITTQKITTVWCDACELECHESSFSKKADAIAEALRAGFVKRGTKFFCAKCAQ